MKPPTPGDSPSLAPALRVWALLSATTWVAMLVLSAGGLAAVVLAEAALAPAASRAGRRVHFAVRCLSIATVNVVVLAARARTWSFTDDAAFSAVARALRVARFYEVHCACLATALLSSYVSSPSWVFYEPFNLAAVVLVGVTNISAHHSTIYTSKTHKRRLRKVADALYYEAAGSRAFLHAVCCVAASFAWYRPSSQALIACVLIRGVWISYSIRVASIVTHALATETKLLGAIDLDSLNSTFCDYSLERALEALPLFGGGMDVDSALLDTAYDVEALKKWWTKQQDASSKRSALVVQAVSCVELIGDGEYVSRLTPPSPLAALDRSRVLAYLASGGSYDVTRRTHILEKCLVCVEATSIRIECSLANSATLPVAPIEKRADGRVVDVSSAYALGPLPEDIPYATESERLSAAFHAQDAARASRNAPCVSRGWWRVNVFGHFSGEVDFCDAERRLRGPIKRTARHRARSSDDILTAAPYRGPLDAMLARSPHQAYAGLLRDAFQVADCVEVCSRLVYGREDVEKRVIAASVRRLHDAMRRYESTHGITPESATPHVRVLRLVAKREAHALN